MTIEKELLDRLLAGRDPNEVFARDGLVDDLKKALRSGYWAPSWMSIWKRSARPEAGSTAETVARGKSVLTGTSKMELSIPRDRAGTFDPKLIANY